MRIGLENAKLNYYAVDFLKCFFALLIYLMHLLAVCDVDIRSPEKYFLFGVISRLGVPFFVVISSYFLFIRINVSPEREKEILINYIKRLMILYGCWFCINSPYVIYKSFILYDGSLYKAILLLIRNFFTGSTFGGSWYLMGSIISAIIVYWLSRRISDNVCLLIGFICYAICCVYTQYSFCMPETVNKLIAGLGVIIPDLSHSFLYTILFFVIGKVIADNNGRVVNAQKGIWFCLLCAGGGSSDF